MKQTIKLRESELRRMIVESVKRVLKETEDYDWDGLDQERKDWENLMSWRNKEEVDANDRVITNDLDGRYMSDEDQKRFDNFYDNYYNAKPNAKRHWDFGYKSGVEDPRNLTFNDEIWKYDDQTTDDPSLYKYYFESISRKINRIVSESVKRVLRESQFMNDEDIASQYKDMRITYFDIKPLTNSDGWEGTFELEFPNADNIDFDGTMVNDFIVYDMVGNQIAWDNWMPDEQTRRLEKIIRQEIVKRTR